MIFVVGVVCDLTSFISPTPMPQGSKLIVGNVFSEQMPFVFILWFSRFVKFQ